MNKRDHSVELTLPQPAKKIALVDQTTKSEPAATRELDDSKYTLGGLGVAVVTLHRSLAMKFQSLTPGDTLPASN